jgi:Asp/Glu/hydantoin racemase
LTTRVVEGAFQAVISGNGTKHDELVSAALREMAKSVDVIVLAQASMARVVDTLRPEDKPVPILSSPRSAIEHLASLLDNDKK